MAKTPAKRTGSRLTAAQKVKRDNEIVRLRLKRTPWNTIASEHDVDPRTARRVYYEWARSNEDKGIHSLKGRDPLEIVWDSVTRYEGWIEQLAEIAWAPETQDNARVGAVNSQMNAQAKLTELLQATGILPKNLGSLRIEADVRYVAQTIVQIMREENVPDQVRGRILDVLRGSGPSQN